MGGSVAGGLHHELPPGVDGLLAPVVGEAGNGHAPVHGLGQVVRDVEGQVTEGVGPDGDRQLMWSAGEPAVTDGHRHARPHGERQGVHVGRGHRGAVVEEEGHGVQRHVDAVHRQAPDAQEGRVEQAVLDLEAHAVGGGGEGPGGVEAGQHRVLGHGSVPPGHGAPLRDQANESGGVVDRIGGGARGSRAVPVWLGTKLPCHWYIPTNPLNDAPVRPLWDVHGGTWSGGDPAGEPINRSEHRCSAGNTWGTTGNRRSGGTNGWVRHTGPPAVVTGTHRLAGVLCSASVMEMLLSPPMMGSWLGTVVGRNGSGGRWRHRWTWWS